MNVKKKMTLQISLAFIIVKITIYLCGDGTKRAFFFIKPVSQTVHHVVPASTWVISKLERDIS